MVHRGRRVIQRHLFNDGYEPRLPNFAYMSKQLDKLFVPIGRRNGEPVEINVEGKYAIYVFALDT
jgi:hypothetical protein